VRERQRERQRQERKSVSVRITVRSSLTYVVGRTSLNPQNSHSLDERGNRPLGLGLELYRGKNKNKDSGDKDKKKWQKYLLAVSLKN
jgi:hypothetical protein